MYHIYIYTYGLSNHNIKVKTPEIFELEDLNTLYIFLNLIIVTVSANS